MNWGKVFRSKPSVLIFCFALGFSQEIGKNCKFFICLLYFVGA
jgi:hypothetical protein